MTEFNDRENQANADEPADKQLSAKDSTDTEEIEDLSVVEKIIGVYVAPISTFRYLAKRPDFWTPFIVLSLIGIAVGLATVPKILPAINSLIVEQMQQTGVPETEGVVAISVVEKLVYASAIIGTPIGLAVSWLLVAAIFFFIALFQGLDADFKRLLGVIPWIHFVSILTTIVAGVLLMGKEISSIEQMKDLGFMSPFSLLGIMPEGMDFPVWLQAIMSKIDPFSIWAVIVTVFALQAANRCTRSQAIITTVITVIISLFFSAVGAAVGAVMGGH